MSRVVHDDIALAVMAERERCAEVAREWRRGCDSRSMQAEAWAAEEIAKAIMDGVIGGNNHVK